MTGPRAGALLALCLAVCTARGVLAISIDAPADFLEANSDEFQCMWALLEKAGLIDPLASPQLSNTYFLPTDAAFITDLAGIIAESGASGKDGPEAGADLSIEDIVALIDAMPEQAAVQFIKAHVSPINYPSVTALAFPEGVLAAALDPFGDSTSQRTIRNSLGQDVSVVYEAQFNALHLDVGGGPDGEPRSSAYIAGPVAIPAGESTLYVMLNIMADLLLITDSGVQAMVAAASNSTVAAASAGPDDDWLLI